MLGDLTPDEMDHLLRRQQLGRLGVTGDGRVYIFPIAYGYDGAFLYGVSQLGLKVRLMRQHPEVCLEVEEVESPARWRTVLAHGTFEELWTEADRDAAFAQIAAQGTLAPLSLAPYTGRLETLIAYRIRVSEKTGRFEHDAVLRAARVGSR
jgi:nitroimidazol reductase NimA-like FMN-containing flavoprotein (pyridoxamine 5'-phosphate oxidase superfamily)